MFAVPFKGSKAGLTLLYRYINTFLSSIYLVLCEIFKSRNRDLKRPFEFEFTSSDDACSQMPPWIAASLLVPCVGTPWQTVAGTGQPFNWRWIFFGFANYGKRSTSVRKSFRIFNVWLLSSGGKSSWWSPAEFFHVFFEFIINWFCCHWIYTSLHIHRSKFGLTIPCPGQSGFGGNSYRSLVQDRIQDSGSQWN